jgi:hypothetical protein
MIGLVAFTRTFTGTDGEVTEGDKIAVLAFGMLEYGRNSNAGIPTKFNDLTRLKGTITTAISGAHSNRKSTLHFNS